MRPIWTGTISFGLLNIPVQLMPGERKTDLHFRMLDSRDNAPIRYERVNAESGEEVPWKDIVKAFEYAKGNYVVLDEDDIRDAASEGRETVEISAFVDEHEIDTRYFEKPYVLTAGRKAEKGYVLLRETLRNQRKVGIARVVIRTREYLSMVKPLGDALVLILLRFPQELIELDEYALPSADLAALKLRKAELDMARQLIESMAVPWQPEDYRDEFRERLVKVIQARLKAGGHTTAVDTAAPAEEEPATNVVDFMALLRQSIESRKRTAAKSPRKAPGRASKAAAKKRAPAKKRAAKKAKRTGGSTTGKRKSAAR
jgi:DNA end-binding protein Ku